MSFVLSNRFSNKSQTYTVSIYVSVIGSIWFNHFQSVAFSVSESPLLGFPAAREMGLGFLLSASWSQDAVVFRITSSLLSCLSMFVPYVTSHAFNDFIHVPTVFI